VRAAVSPRLRRAALCFRPPGGPDAVAEPLTRARRARFIATGVTLTLALGAIGRGGGRGWGPRRRLSVCFARGGVSCRGRLLEHHQRDDREHHRERCVVRCQRRGSVRHGDSRARGVAFAHCGFPTAATGRLAGTESNGVSVSRPDVAALPDLMHGSSRAGPVRERRPLYVDLLPPCNAGCPAGENIQAWLADMQAGRHEQAWRQLVADNPFPAIHGRVCYHPCETVCNRAELDSAVSIHAVERFPGGSGARPGVDVRRAIGAQRQAGAGRRFRAERTIGGLSPRQAGPYGRDPRRRRRAWRNDALRHPDLPMPRDVLDGELARITALGVRIECGHRVDDLAAEREEGNFDAVFVAVGAHLSKRVDIPAGDAGHIVDALSFLRSVASASGQ